MSTKPPIIILGNPHSGTRLVARILGLPANHFLITEHEKKSLVPEENSTISDKMIWWQNFTFKYWDEKTQSPAVRTPFYDPTSIAKARTAYLELAKNKRLITKNPQHTTRVKILKEMFPDAYFIFCVRNPWQTIQSCKSNPPSIIKTYNNFRLKNDWFLKAAFSWAEAIDIYQKEKNEKWALIRYTDLIQRPEEIINGLFGFLNIEKEKKVLEKASQLPKLKRTNYYFIKQYLNHYPDKEKILNIVKPGCQLLGYPIEPKASKIEAFEFYKGLYLEKIKNKISCLKNN